MSKIISSNLLRNLITSLLIGSLLFAASNILTAQTIVINEIMASNASTIADEDGDYEDWIELYNFGSEPVSLQGYGLSDDFSNPFRWIFPDVTIQPGEFLLVWASGKNRTDLSAPLHTSFSISASGEEVLITHPSGTRVDEIQPTTIPTDISYGRQPDGTGEWFFFNVATPGESNTTTAYSEILEPPVFSHAAGFYSQEFELSITHPDPDVTIYYTLDGSVPDPGNLNGELYLYKQQYSIYPQNPIGEFHDREYKSHVYQSPIIIYDRSDEPDILTQISTTVHNPDYFPDEPVMKGMVVRAIATKDNCLYSPVISGSYYINPQGTNPFQLPVISIVIPEHYLFDYELGIYTAGIDADEWRLNNPDEIMYWPFRGNFRRRGVEWEYPARFELIEPGASFTSFSQDVGLRIHGGGTRSFPMKTLRIYARNRYGAESLDYPFFPDLPHESFRRIILRNSGNDFPTTVWWSPVLNSRTMFRDAAIQELVKHLEFKTQAYRPSIVFINGEFWGIHNIRERIDKHFIERYFSVDPENIDLIESQSGVIEGDNTFNSLTRNYIRQNGLVSDEHYQYILTRIDEKSFADYHIANIYANNTDWPDNNISYWRLRTDSFQPNAPYGHDGRFRYLMFDTDFGFGLWDGSQAVSFNTLAFATEPGGTSWPNPDGATFMLREFLENPDFKVLFVNRFADLLNTAFTPLRVVSVINEMRNEIAEEMPLHIKRWKYHNDLEEWDEHIQVMIDFANERPLYQRQHIAEYFSLDGEVDVLLDVSNRWHGHIRVNTIDVKDGTPGISGNPYPWTGIYFKDIPIEVEAIPATGYAFSHWEGLPDGTPAIASITPEDDIALKAHFVRSNDSQLIYFWVFDAGLANNTPFEQLNATFPLQGNGLLQYHSALEGYPFHNGHPNWRKASMERRNSPTSINYRPVGNNNKPYEESDMRGLQIKQPFTGDGGENTMVFHLPTSDYHEVIFRFAAKDEGAADELVIDYSVTPGNENWIADDITSVYLLSDDYQLYEIDFSEIPAVNDNPDFRIRIRFTGQDMSADDGNRVTFNNFSLDGKLIAGTNLPPIIENEIGFQQLIESGHNLEVDLYEVFNDPDNDPLTFSAISMNTLCASVSINNSHLVVNPLQRGDAVITVLADDGQNEPVATSFRILIYPEAYKPGENNFSFTSWDHNEQEYSYPPHMLFLQSEVNEPGLDTPLLYPYYIPHNDYHSDDEATTGFPYNNTRRTRINGLGEDGISFINTGRGRDLGGALVAIDTRGLTSANLNWLAGTILENSRKYGIRLQYRIHVDDPFNDLLVNGELVEYITGADGEMMNFDSIALPPEVLDEEYVQLLWRYYHIEGDTGPRAELRLDEIHFTDVIGISEVIRDAVEIYSHGGIIHVRLPFDNAGAVFVYDITGRLVHERHFNRRCSITLNRASGIYIVRVVVGDFIKSGKVFVR